ncbi:hypothetical protein V6Z11_D03G082500 [Gossypium hirsutum]
MEFLFQQCIFFFLFQFCSIFFTYFLSLSTVSKQASLLSKPSELGNCSQLQVIQLRSNRLIDNKKSPFRWKSPYSLLRWWKRWMTREKKRSTGSASSGADQSRGSSTSFR